MKLAEKQKVFDYVRENVPFELKLDNSVDYIIDFKNGESFSIYDIDDYYDDYFNIDVIITDFIADRELDDVIDCGYIKNRFAKYEDYFMHNQACLIDFKDFVLKNVVILANSEKVNYD
ncbi:MAG: hypothetical protein RR623_08275 [Bacilli bacterium]